MNGNDLVWQSSASDGGGDSLASLELHNVMSASMGMDLPGTPMFESNSPHAEGVQKGTECTASGVPQETCPGPETRRIPPAPHCTAVQSVTEWQWTTQPPPANRLG